MITQEKVEELREKLGVKEDVDLTEVEKSMTYSLADAIREGCTTTNQAIGTWDRKDGAEVCALSAALLAVRARRLLD